MAFSFVALLLAITVVFAKVPLGPFHHVETTSEGNVFTSTYLSKPLPLKPGWVIQSDPFQTKMEMPQKGWIRGIHAQVVDSKNQSVLLSEVYLHHWVFLNSNGNAGPCSSLGFAVGVGAETRGTPINFPDGYGVKIVPGETWLASIHVIRTNYVENVKHCIECHCPGGPTQGGGIQCCPTTQQTNISCPITSGAPDTFKDYFLKYVVTWEPETSDLTALTLVELDVTKCTFQYNVPQCADPTSACIHLQEHTFISDFEGEVVFMYGHMHIGGINVTLTMNDDVVYNALPTYGTGVKPGNEKGYLVAISTETITDHSVKVAKGDSLKVSAHYHSDVYHDGVMGFLLMAIAESK